MRAFRTILNAALERTGGASRLEARLPVPASGEELAAVGDDRYLSQMCLRVFRAGLKHSLVDARWPAFEEVFHGFAPGRVSLMDDGDLEACMSNSALIRHWPKIRSVRANAAAMERVIDEHGGFGRWLAAWPADDVVGLWDRLARDFNQLGGSSGAWFLRMVRKDTFLLTGDVVRSLIAHGVVETRPTGKADRRAVQDAFNGWAEETGRPLCQLSFILALAID